MPDAWAERVAAAEARLLSGYDPERENGQPRRSDEWCRALGWADELMEEAVIDAETRKAF